MNCFRSVLLILWLCCCRLMGIGQTHSYVHYDTRDGLAGTTVYSMAQDHDGFIWFATETGLSRFDGTNFKTYTIQDGLPDNEIIKLYVDSRNRIWFAPFKSTIGYILDGKIHTAANDTVLAKVKIFRNIDGMMENKHGTMCFNEEFSLHFIDSANKVSEISTLTERKVGFVKAGQNENGEFRLLETLTWSLGFFDLVNDSFSQVRFLKTIHWTNGLGCVINPNYEVCIAFERLLFHDPRSKTDFSLPIPKGWLGLSEVNDSLVAVNRYSGSYFVNMRQKKVVDSFLTDQTVNGVMQDAEGNFWFSTLNNGIYRLTSQDVGVFHLRENDHNLSVFSIRAYDSVVYFGGDHFQLGELNLRNRRFNQVEVQHNYSRGRIMDIARLQDGKLLMGTDNGLYHYNPKTHTSSYFDFLLSVKTIQVYDSLVLVATNRGTIEFELNHMRLNDSLTWERTVCAYRDSGGTYYLGTLNGLETMHRKERPFMWGKRDSLVANRINAFAAREDGVLWVATGGYGLLGFKNGKVFVDITDKNGLVSNNCKAVCVSGKDVWVGTDRGLSKVIDNGGNYTVRNYTMANGLSSDMINVVYAYGNDIYVGTPVGVDVFDEAKIVSKSASLLRMTGITVSDRRWPKDTVGFELDHKNNNIKFDYAGISFKSGGRIQYQYRLQGLDTGWKSTRETFLSYPSLPSGDYELQLVAINEFGVRSRQLSIPFRVGKQLLEMWWFRLLLVGVVSLIVFVYFNYRVKLVRKKEEEKSEINTRMAELEQMALRSQMNPHFIFNCLNSIQQYVIYRDVLGANEFITKFSYLIRQTLDLSSRKVISLYEEINYIDTYMALEKKRFDDKFIYEIVVAAEVDKSACHIPPMILQPYIENAIRHGIGLRNDNDGRIYIKLLYQAGELVCIIEDNGVGRKVAKRFKSANSIAYQSVGMSLVSKRIEMINKTSSTPVSIHIEDLEDVDGKPLGTRINIHFPLEVVLS